MFERHFGLRENPFHSGHELRFLYPSREHQEARAHLRFGIENREPFVLITGEVGTGKTTALYDALAEWGTQVAVALITNSALTRQELIEEIDLRFGINVPPGASKPQALALLERHLAAVRSRGEYAVLLLDEAQNLAPELLEEIRLLSNLEVQGERLLQIFLVGQPELEAILAQPKLRQLRQRITVHYRLNPLSPEETGAYVHHRIAVAGGSPWAAFPPETCREVYRITHGIPREINTLASQAMIAAYSEGSTTVRAEHVHVVARENEFKSVLGAPAPEPDPPMPGEVVPHVATPAASAPAPPPPPPAPIPPPPAAPPAEPIAREPGRHPLPPEEVPPAPSPVEPQPLRVPTPLPGPAPFEIPDTPSPVEPDPEPASPPPSPPAAQATPAWTPPELADAPQPAPALPPVATPPAPEPVRTETHSMVMREVTQKVDAWTSAAQELMEARKRQGVPEAAPRVEIVATPATTQAARIAPPPVAPRFPSPAELQARSATAQPDRADLSALPGRLRDKIASDIAAEESREAARKKWMPLVAVVLVVIVLAGAAMVLQQMHVLNLPFLGGKPATASPAHHEVAATATPAQVADTLPHAGPGSSTPVTREPVAVVRPHPAAPTTQPAAHAPAAATTVPPAASTSHPAATTPSASAPKPAASEKPAATATAAGDSVVYGLGVASYLDRDRAEQERARLASASGLPSSVVPFTEDGTAKFRVVIGHYPSNNAAENAALALMEKLGINEARPLVLSRPRR